MFTIYLLIQWCNNIIRRKFSGNLFRCCFVFFVAASIYENLKTFHTFHADDVVHTIVKRGIKQSDHPFNVIKEVQFKTLGKDFRLILTPRREVIHSKFKAYTVDGDGNETPFHVGK